jgi:hypothetical protein
MEPPARGAIHQEVKRIGMTEVPPLASDSHPVEWAAFVSIDWADRTHVWALQEVGSSQIEQGELEHTPEAIDLWASQLAGRFPGRRVAVALEQSKGGLIYALAKYAHLVLYPVHPGSLANFREALYPSHCKDDPSDAVLLLEFLVHYRGRLRRLEADTPETRLLQGLLERRRRLVDQRTALTNQ